jgi:hypothetical protein
MKNIHILSTERSSQLYCYNERPNKFFIDLLRERIPVSIIQHKNIYITSDEKIKKGDWYIADNKLYKASVNHMPELYTYPCKKINLTTDQDLIKDGVQAIDDEFLEWFVDNPSCEEVKIEKIKIYFTTWGFKYKITIPKEESKQETLEEFINTSNTPEGLDQFSYDKGLLKGAKWQQERSYSEEEVLEIMRQSRYNEFGIDNIKEWFEQFKKK